MQLDPDQKAELLQAAREAAGYAYCPSSHFRVGAAVLAGGRVFRGCNIENASLGLTICAERVAIFNAVSSGVTKITALAVACLDASESSPINMRTPCGACRQVMAEFAPADLPVVIDRAGDFSLSQLLPIPFKL
jgi:cytidine deaminase